jgi:hypothetical protein
VSDFFEAPPPPPERPREHRQPEWFGPPDNVLPVVVPLALVLARAPGLALAVRSVDVYPNGAVFHALLVLREQVGDPMKFMPFHPRQRELEPDVLRVGVQYADGGKATNLDMPFLRRNTEEPPDGPVMMPSGGGGGGRRWDMSFWLWPLPTKDPFQIVVEWPARGIDLARFDVDVAPIVDAASRCEELWPNGGASDGGGSTFLSVIDRE